jgi:hypothetical protein
VLRIENDADRHDDRAIALALAAQHLLGQRPASTDGEGANFGTLGVDPFRLLKGGSEALRPLDPHEPALSYLYRTGKL